MASSSATIVSIIKDRCEVFQTSENELLLKISECHCTPKNIRSDSKFFTIINLIIDIANSFYVI